MRAFADAGATLLFGSDAPVSPIDPWTTIAEAVVRERGGEGGAGAGAWHPEQALSHEQALAASTHGGAGIVRPGAVADLVIVGADPLAASAEQLRAMPVFATLVAGRVTHLAD